MKKYKIGQTKHSHLQHRIRLRRIELYRIELIRIELLVLRIELIEIELLGLLQMACFMNLIAKAPIPTQLCQTVLADGKKLGQTKNSHLHCLKFNCLIFN